MAVKRACARLALVGLWLVVLLGGVSPVTGAMGARPVGPEYAAVQPDRRAASLALLERLSAATGGNMRVSYHAGTGLVRFVGMDGAHALRLRESEWAGVGGDKASAEAAARAFLHGYGALFGVMDQAQDLRVMRTSATADGRRFVRFQQVVDRLPVIAGELVVQVDANHAILSANGELLAQPKVSIEPKVDAGEARKQAQDMVAKEYQLPASDPVASEPAQWVYHPVLLGAPGIQMARLVWRMEVRSQSRLDVREFVLVDAAAGGIALHFNQVDTARVRRIYDNANNPSAGLPGYGPVRNESGAPTGVSQADAAYEYAGDVYDYYRNNHGRDSLDALGMPLVVTVRYCEPGSGCPYANAFWNGTQMTFGDGFVTDDVMGHEMTHGVTEHTSNLFYYMQSGAINESLSDVFGEFIDLTDGRGDDNAANRWLLGEEVPGGAIRDMRDPAAFGDPDRVTSSNWWCSLYDFGGVHANSGVNNKACYLMADGDTFNGRTVTGLGISKVSCIYYEAETNLLTSGADYQDLYDILIQAATNLVGSGGIIAADVDQVRLAAQATEMNLQPTGCPAPDAPLCSDSTPNDLWYDNLEDVAQPRWASAVLAGDNPWNYPTSGYATSGLYALWGQDLLITSDSVMAMRSSVPIPPGAYLHFRHAFDIERTYDGGVVEYSLDEGSTWADAGGLFSDNGYNGTLASDTTNPLAGRAAFTGVSYGFTSSRLDLAPLAGKSVRFRFRMGTDEATGSLGWVIDDVRIYTCGSSAVPLPDVSPSEWNVVTAVGQVTTRELTIKNMGTGLLNFSLSDVETAPRVASASWTAGGRLTVQPTLQGTAEQASVWPGSNVLERQTASRARVTYAPASQAGAGRNLLVYTDDAGRDAGQTYIELALQRLGLAYTAYYADAGGFVAALAAPPGGRAWDAVLVSHNAWFDLGRHWPALEAYYNQGGRLVIETFDMDGSSSVPTTLWRTLGVQWTADVDVLTAMYRWDTSHPVFSRPEAVPNFTGGYREYLDNGDRGSSAPGMLAVGGLTPEVMPGQGNVFARMDRRAVVNSYVISEHRGDLNNDGLPDAAELWEDEIAYVLGLAQDASWLTCLPTSGSVDPGVSVTVTLRLDATGQLPGNYAANLRLAHNASAPNPITVPVTLTVISPAVTLTNPTLWTTSYGASNGAGGWSSQDIYPRAVADVNGDRKADIVGFGGLGVYVSLSTGTGMGAPRKLSGSFGAAPAGGGWTSQTTYPRLLGDVNGDGKADIVGFGGLGVYVALSTGGGLGPMRLWSGSFGAAPAAGGWSDQTTYPRLLGDANGDGKADVVGFGSLGVYVALSTGSGFGPMTRWSTSYGTGTVGGRWASQTTYPRLLGDVDGDGKTDLVGFALDGVYVALSNGRAFGSPSLWSTEYRPGAGWPSQNVAPRLLADVNRDGRADAVGFGADGIRTSLSTGSAFLPSTLFIANWGANVGGWVSQDLYPRMVADLNCDAKPDIVGFGSAGTYVSLGK